MKMLKFLGIKNEDGVVDKLIELGYNLKHDRDTYDMNWLFVIIYGNEFDYGYLTDGAFNNRTDIEININDLPLRKNLNEYVDMLNNANKLGLL